jgi:8-oxo-dGTP pyrophosphatase MutT (NUDIX family)
MLGSCPQTDLTAAATTTSAPPSSGQLELGESHIHAAVRELREETGITIEVTGLIGIYSSPAHVITYDDEVRQEFSICFRARPTH